MSSENTLYVVLGVAPDATPEQIAAAALAREQALRGDADALSLLRVAGATLRDPQQRAAYDRRLAERRAFAEAAPAAVAVIEAGDRRPPVRWRGWLAFVAAAGGSAGYLLLSPPPAGRVPPPTVVVAPAVPAPAPVAEPPAQEETPPPPAAGDAAPAETAVETPPPLAAKAAVAEAPPAPRRGAKQPGFDARYVAWSVFIVRQRNLTGSGVLIGPDRILTNCHVLAGGATNGIVAVHSLTQRVFRVEKYARLDGEDACLLLAPGAGGDAIAWGSAATLQPGDTVHALGHPGGSSAVSWSEGSVRLRTERGGETFIISDNYCRPGSSGGPLLDGEGRLVGIVTAVQRYQARGGEPPRFGACISLSEATARALLAKPLFPIALAPAQYLPAY